MPLLNGHRPRGLVLAMAEREQDHSRGETVVVRRNYWARNTRALALFVILMLIAAIALVWIERPPIATEFLQREFERRGVQATYKLDRVGFERSRSATSSSATPSGPTWSPRYAQIQMRLKWNGSFEVYRIVARGVRLPRPVRQRRVSWGQVDKLLPPPSGKPFELPNFVLDVADSTHLAGHPVRPARRGASG
jgi:hypothetical protein